MRGDDLGDRLCQIHDGIRAIVVEQAAVEIAAEKVFVHRNPSSAIKLGQARGAAIVAGVGAGLKFFEYSPNEIKQAITGRGHADKQQIQHMVKLLLGLVARCRPAMPPTPWRWPSATAMCANPACAWPARAAQP